MGGNLFYWFQWANGGKFVDHHDALEQWPRMVYDFLEAAITFDEPTGVKTQIDGKRQKPNTDFYVGNQIRKFTYLFLFNCITACFA